MTAFTFAVVCAWQLAAAQHGALSGYVRDAAGTAIAAAEVRVGGTALATAADDSGFFRFINVPVGSVTVTARRIGFRPAVAEATIVEGKASEVTLTLAPLPVRLEPVTVLAHREPYDARLAGFRARLKNHAAGSFITRDRFDANPSAALSDFMREIPGVKLVTLASGIRNAMRFRGQACPPIVYIDGFPATADEFDIDIVDPASVEGVEVYMSMLTAPPEMMAPRGLSSCGVVAIWSRPYRPVPRAGRAATPGDLQRMLDAGQVFTADQVDVAVRLDRESFNPPYPDSLWNTYTGGFAVVEFVVDALGHVELETFNVVSASRAAFAEAVYTGVARARFSAALKDGRPVRQIVHLPARFSRPRQ